MNTTSIKTSLHFGILHNLLTVLGLYLAEQFESNAEADQDHADPLDEAKLVLEHFDREHQDNYPPCRRNQGIYVLLEVNYDEINGDLLVQQLKHAHHSDVLQHRRVAVHECQRGEESALEEGNCEDYEECVEVVGLEQVVGGWLECALAVGLEVNKEGIRDHSQNEQQDSDVFLLSLEVFDPSYVSLPHIMLTDSSQMNSEEASMITMAIMILLLAILSSFLCWFSEKNAPKRMKKKYLDALAITWSGQLTQSRAQLLGRMFNTKRRPNFFLEQRSIMFYLSLVSLAYISAYAAQSRQPVHAKREGNSK